jgi:hypothetical protein
MAEPEWTVLAEAGRVRLLEPTGVAGEPPPEAAAALQRAAGSAQAPQGSGTPPSPKSLP